MTTVRQIQRLWSGKAFDKLVQHLLLPRAEASPRLMVELGGPVAAAAMVVIRLDEMAQTFAPLYAEAVRVIVAAQSPQGGWGEPALTALCLRALMCGRGHGAAVERGLAYLGGLQKDEGIWPNPPIRRLPSDPFASAFILMQLGDTEPFRAAVRLADAVDWFESNLLTCDEPTRRLWSHAARRCRTRPAARAAVTV